MFDICEKQINDIIVRHAGADPGFLERGLTQGSNL